MRAALLAVSIVLLAPVVLAEGGGSVTRRWIDWPFFGGIAATCDPEAAAGVDAHAVCYRFGFAPATIRLHVARDDPFDPGLAQARWSLREDVPDLTDVTVLGPAIAQGDFCGDTAIPGDPRGVAIMITFRVARMPDCPDGASDVAAGSITISYE